TDRGAPRAPHPTACIDPTAPDLPGRPRRLSVAARLGEPSEVTASTRSCQPKNAGCRKNATAPDEFERDARARNCALNFRQVSGGANAEAVSRTDPDPSSQPHQMVLFLAFAQHEQSPADRLIARQ